MLNNFLLDAAHGWLRFSRFVAPPACALVASKMIWDTASEYGPQLRTVKDDSVAVAAKTRNMDVLRTVVEAKTNFPADAAQNIIHNHKDAAADPMLFRLLDIVLMHGASADLALEAACDVNSSHVVEYLLRKRAGVPEWTAHRFLEAKYYQAKWKPQTGASYLTAQEADTAATLIEAAVIAGADVSYGGVQPPLYWALRLQDPKLVQLLVDMGADVTAKMGRQGNIFFGHRSNLRTPLEWAIDTRNAEIVAIVLKASKVV